jgi:cell division protein FtsI (penicillin-binding protein 3)
VLGGRLVQLQGLDSPRFAAAAEHQRLASTVLPAVRGQILDRDGRVLAYTVAARTIFADPKLVKDPAATAAALAPLIGETATSLEPKLRKPRTRYVPLARNLSPSEAARVLALKLPGIAAEGATERIYPGRESGASVLGFTNSAGSGAAGIEQQYDEQLAGRPGELVVETGEHGQVIPSGVRRETPAVPGASVRLTISEDLQFMVQQALSDAVRQTHAKGGQIVVLDAKTAQVLAMASTPTYDAQRPGRARPENRGNPAVQSVFEPGSANKVVTFAAALERGVIRPDTPMLVPDAIQISDRVVHDAWWHKPTWFTATGVLAKSSNVGTLMIATRKLGPLVYYDYLRRFGIGSKTGIQLPAESGGLLKPPEQWSGSTFGNLPIGQGVSMTALQLASMYQTVANDGVRVAPSIVSSVNGPGGQVTVTSPGAQTRVVSVTTARTLRRMLEAVTQKGGTAPSAAIDGYRVAGKTGTAQKPNPRCHCYSGGGYWATFVGIAPADDPQFVVSVVIDDAKGGLHGGAVAAPLFKSIASYALTERGIPPSGPYRPTFQLTLD